MQTKNVNAKKTANLTKINFDKFAAKVQNFSEKNVSTQRSTLYNYPEKWNEIQINGHEGKAFRTSKRNALFNFCNLIGLYYKMKNAESLISEIAKFDKFYKEFFKLNDYSINSLTNTKGAKNAMYVDMLQIIKEVKFASEKPAKKSSSKKKVATVKKEVAKIEEKKEENK